MLQDHHQPVAAEAIREHHRAFVHRAHGRVRRRVEVDAVLHGVGVELRVLVFAERAAHPARRGPGKLALEGAHGDGHVPGPAPA